MGQTITRVLSGVISKSICNRELALNYQITLYGNRIYKEIKLADTFESVTIGTFKECQVSLKREYFLTDFRIEIRRQDDSYVALCNEDICLKSGTGNTLGQLRCEVLIYLFFGFSFEFKLVLYFFSMYNSFPLLFLLHCYVGDILKSFKFIF